MILKPEQIQEGMIVAPMDNKGYSLFVVKAIQLPLIIARQPFKSVLSSTMFNVEKQSFLLLCVRMILEDIRDQNHLITEEDLKRQQAFIDNLFPTSLPTTTPPSRKVNWDNNKTLESNNV